MHRGYRPRPYILKVYGSELVLEEQTKTIMTLINILKQTELVKFRRVVLLLFFACISSMITYGNTLLINEVMYRQTSPSSPVRFIEIYNTTNSTIDLTGYKIAGDVNYTIPAGNTIAPFEFAVIAANASELLSAYNIGQNVKVFGDWSGTLALDAGNIQLLNANSDIVDELQYEGWGVWPSTDGNNGKSIQKINPTLSSNYGGAWDKGTPTPGTSNQSVFVLIPNIIPIVNQISHEPKQPKANEEVLITVNITNSIATTNLVLEYQLVDPGSYIGRNDAAYNNDWTPLTMNDVGTGGDVLANDGIFSVKIPSNLQTNRRLVRYRININNNNNYNRLFPDQSFEEANFCYFVYDKHSLVNGYDINELEELQTFFFISKGIDNLRVNYSGTVVVDAVVYDHVGFRKLNYYTNPRRNYRADFNDGRPVAVEDDYGNVYKQKRDRLNLSGTDMCDKSSHGLTESLILKMFELTGSAASYADYTHLRFIDDSDPNTDFQGIHVIRDYVRNNKDVNGDFLKLRDMPDGNFYGYKNPYGVLYEGELAPYGHFNTAYNEWSTGWDDFSDGCSRCPVTDPPLSFLEEKLDLDNHYGFMVAQEYIANNETNYGGQHNYYEYYNPIKQKWLVIPDDFNAAFGTPRDEDGFALRSEFDPTEDVRGPFKQSINNYESLRVEFENQIRSGLDLLLNEEQSAMLVDNEVKKIYNVGNSFNWTDVDKSKWKQNYGSYEEVIQDYKDFFIQRATHLKATYGSSKAPNKPSVSYTGPANFSTNQLSFTASDFIDPQGNNTFASLEWRVGEWSDPNNPVYEYLQEDIYEITPVWHSGDLTDFSNNYTIQNANLINGRTYRVRVRYKDNTGRKSDWSDPFEFIPAFADQDNDGISDTDDSCPTLNNTLFGQVCDDGNENTILDVYDGNSCTCIGIISDGTFCTRIKESTDDAEEYITNGSMTLTSGDLDMATDNGVSFIVGLRFQNLAVPQGAFIRNATIQFTADERNTQLTNLIFTGEAIDHAAPFTTRDKNISDRSKTNASVVWSPESWTVGANGSKQQSVNLAPIIREIVNRPDFVAGNAIAILVEGTGSRTAESYDGAPSLAPELCLDFILDPCIIGEACDDENPNTMSSFLDSNCNCVGVYPSVQAKVFLEGFYAAADNEMHTTLKDINLIPLTQPYNRAPWNYTGTESVVAIPTGAVDWILLMSRDVAGNILEQSAGFINQDGQLLAIDGTLGIAMENGFGNTISIHHQSHLAVASASPYNGGLYDFTIDINQAKGMDQLKQVGNRYVLYAGDYDASGIINNIDFNKWKVQSATLNKYLPIDGDGNGIINASDYNLWIINRSKIGEEVIRF